MPKKDKEEYIPPPRTARQIFDMLPEGTLIEIKDEVIYVTASRITTHHLVLGEIACKMHLHVDAKKLGECLMLPIDIYFDDNTIMLPDIVFISNANAGIIKAGRIKGTPDLLVEVLEENRKHDLKFKKALYEKFGVKEYFIVDPANKQTITYYHDGKKYIQQDSKPGKIKSKLLKKTFTF